MTLIPRYLFGQLSDTSNMLANLRGFRDAA